LHEADERGKLRRGFYSEAHGNQARCIFSSADETHWSKSPLDHRAAFGQIILPLFFKTPEGVAVFRFSNLARARSKAMFASASWSAMFAKRDASGSPEKLLRQFGERRFKISQ